MLERSASDVSSKRLLRVVARADRAIGNRKHEYVR
jgi:hypothetical protein